MYNEVKFPVRQQVVKTCYRLRCSDYLLKYLPPSLYSKTPARSVAFIANCSIRNNDESNWRFFYSQRSKKPDQLANDCGCCQSQPAGCQARSTLGWKLKINDRTTPVPNSGESPLNVVATDFYMERYDKVFPFMALIPHILRFQVDTRQSSCLDITLQFS